MYFPQAAQPARIYTVAGAPGLQTLAFLQLLPAPAGLNSAVLGPQPHSPLLSLHWGCGGDGDRIFAWLRGGGEGSSGQAALALSLRWAGVASGDRDEQRRSARRTAEPSVKSPSFRESCPPPGEAHEQRGSLPPAEGSGRGAAGPAPGRGEGLLRDSGAPGKSVAAKTMITTLSKKNDVTLLRTFLERVPKEGVGQGLPPLR